MPGMLALDSATLLGWAYCMPGGPLQFGERMLGGPGAEPGKVGAALDWFLSEQIARFGPELIGYEQPFKSPNFLTEFKLFGMGFYIDTQCELRGIEYGSVIGIEATKALTGRGKFPGKNKAEQRKAKKRATMEACWARGWKASENAADAIAVLLVMEAKRFPAAALTRPMVLKPARGPLFEEVGA